MSLVNRGRQFGFDSLGTIRAVVVKTQCSIHCSIRSNHYLWWAVSTLASFRNISEVKQIQWWTNITGSMAFIKIKME